MKKKEFGSFIELLKKKAESDRKTLNEAILRYYYAVSECNDAESVLLEVPIADYIDHNKEQYRKKKSHCKFDLYYQIDEIAIEFKYHRRTDKSQSCTTSKAGAAFADLNRLSLLNCEKRYFIYLIDEQMKNYYENILESMKESLFSFKTKPKKYFSKNFSFKESKEFNKVAFSGFNKEGKEGFKELNYSVKRAKKEKLSKGLYLMIFEIFG